MLKRLIKLAIAALVANACWRVGSAYASFYRFKDSVAESARYSKGKSEEQLHDRVIELAATYEVPVAEDSVVVTRKDNHVYVVVSYTKIIDLVPGYEYPWPFNVNIDAYTVDPF